LPRYKRESVFKSGNTLVINEQGMILMFSENGNMKNKVVA